MSWRLLFAVLIVTAGASAWAGLQLGDWLVAHAPESPAEPEHPELNGQVILDADGKPFVSKAPQPLVTGRQAIPEPTDPVQWDIVPESIRGVLDNPLISVATTPITMEEARQLASLNGGQDSLEGIADLSGLNLSGRAGQGGARQPLQPIDAPSPPPTMEPSPELSQAVQPAVNGNWLAALRQELDVCSNTGFFSRPSCAWAARNKYCGPANAWGQVQECPARH